MNYRLRILSEAESDLREAYHWYQERRHGLGAEFIGAVEAYLGSIQIRPLAFLSFLRKSAGLCLEDFLTEFSTCWSKTQLRSLLASMPSVTPARFSAVSTQPAVHDR